MATLVATGRLGADAELRSTTGGTEVLSWSMAYETGYGDKKKSHWIKCALFGKRASSLQQYLTKGTAVAVSGDLSKREHEGKTYLTVRVSEVTLQGGTDRAEKPRQQDRGTSYDRDDKRTQGGSYGRSNDLDDEIPFAPEFR